MFGRVGFWEITIIIIIALVVFGPNKLPELGKALGRGIREFKDATDAMTKELKDASAAAQAPVAQTPAAQPPATQPAATQPAAAPETSATTAGESAN